MKHTHAEQMSRLQIKHQTECDLLEDLRTFSQKRSAVERDYAQALQKLANQYLKKEWPESLTEEQTDQRISACDNYKVQVADPAKTVRLQKEQQLRKCIDQLTVVQAELQDSVKELTKSRKKYQEAETMAQAVREKAELDANLQHLIFRCLFSTFSPGTHYQLALCLSTLQTFLCPSGEFIIERWSRLSLFQSRSSLQRATVKLKAKRSECNSKATHSRNDYILMLAAANAHQQRYYNTDLMDCIKVLDGRIYEQVKDYLVSLCQTELESYQAVHNTFNQLLNSSNGEFHQQLFVEKNLMFQQAPDFIFQPSDTDTVLELQKESGTTEEQSLDKEARKWASRAMEGYETQESTEQNNTELETKMEVARQSLRRAETVKVKAEARLELLRQAGVAVETWLKSAMNQVMEELENERWNNLNTHDPSLSDEEEMEDSGEVLDDSSSSPSSTLKNYPLTCKVLYSYKSSQPDELTIEEQEILEVIDDGDMEDWVKKYLQLPSSNSLLSMLQALAALDARSHSSSAIIRILSRETHEDDGFWEGEFNGVVGVFPAVLVEDLTCGPCRPPAPKQHPRGQVKRREEVEITLVCFIIGFLLCNTFIRTCSEHEAPTGNQKSPNTHTHSIKTGRGWSSPLKKKHNKGK
ncbi:hypothetical protein F7725_006480, partial [Dissostichus mawsoni]